MDVFQDQRGEECERVVQSKTHSQSVSQSPEAIVDMPHTNSVLGFSTKSFSTLKPSRATITDPPFQIIWILHSWIVEQNS